MCIIREGLSLRYILMESWGILMLESSLSIKLVIAHFLIREWINSFTLDWIINAYKLAVIAAVVETLGGWNKVNIDWLFGRSALVFWWEVLVYIALFLGLISTKLTFLFNVRVTFWVLKSHVLSYLIIVIICSLIEGENIFLLLICIEWGVELHIPRFNTLWIFITHELLPLVQTDYTTRTSWIMWIEIVFQVRID